jgi:hypothetical protein
MRRLEESLTLWNLALDSEFGVEIANAYCDVHGIDTRQLVADLYESRKLSGDVRFFQFYIHQAAGAVWIVRCRAPEIKSNGEYKPLEDV